MGGKSSKELMNERPEPLLPFQMITRHWVMELVPSFVKCYENSLTTFPPQYKPGFSMNFFLTPNLENLMNLFFSDLDKR